MALDFELDVAPEDDFEKIDAGGKVVPGLYFCTCTDAIEVDEKAQIHLEFTIAAGPFKGKKQTYYLPNPAAIFDSDKRTKAEHRFKMLASRVGIVTKEMIERRKADPTYRISLSWINAIGKPCWVEVTRQVSTRQDGTVSDFTGISYGGVWPPGHAELPKKFKEWNVKPGPDQAGGAASNAGPTGTSGAPPAAATPPANKYAGII